MLEGGDWIIPHLDSLVYLEKPPLQYWLTAATYRILGESEFTARLKALWLMMGSTLFVLMGHQPVTLDMVLSTWLQASLTCFLLAESETASSQPSPRRHARWMLESCGGSTFAGDCHCLRSSPFPGSSWPRAKMQIFSITFLFANMCSAS